MSKTRRKNQMVRYDPLPIGKDRLTRHKAAHRGAHPLNAKPCCLLVKPNQNLSNIKVPILWREQASRSPWIKSG
jgi:hypothetical protein